MRLLYGLIGIVLVSGLATAVDRARVFRFDYKDAERLPDGWKADHTGKGEGSTWKIVPDNTAPSKGGYVLAQTAQSPNPYYNLCITEDTSYKDLICSVAFKALRGHNDQGGGIVWRYRDHDNYYIARMNPLESNFRVYRVVAGKRQQLQSKEDLHVKAGQWHTLRIEMKGSHIECSFDDKPMLDVNDDTFPGAGKIGLWTKSDAQTHFDKFEVENLAH